GGSVAFYLGEKVEPEYYNQKLYAEGKGIFPVPLAGQPTPHLTEEQKFERRFDGQYKVFFRDPTHPLFAELFKDEAEHRAFLDFLKFLVIDRYYPVPRLKWKNESGQAKELMTLPNRRSIDDYKDEAQDILRKLPRDEEKYQAYRPGLDRHQ